jgi:ribosomal protein S18 acetylase RimI-like enzyme
MTYSHALHEGCRFRAAQERDAACVADFIIISGDTPPDFPRPVRYDDGHVSSAADVRLSRKAQVFALKHTRLLQFGGRTAGMFLGYDVLKLSESAQLWALPNYLRPTMDVENLSPRSFYVNTLALYPEFQNLGLGGVLLDAAEYAAASRGCEHLTLEVGVGNPLAIKFYLRSEFEQIALLSADGAAPPPYDKDIVLLRRAVSYACAMKQNTEASSWRATHTTWRLSEPGRADTWRRSGPRNSV